MRDLQCVGGDSDSHMVKKGRRDETRRLFQVPAEGERERDREGEREMEAIRRGGKSLFFFACRQAKVFLHSKISILQ